MLNLTKISHRKYLVVLGVLFGIQWFILAINPWYRSDWALENVAVVIVVLCIALSHKKLLLSRLSYTMIFVFLCLHEIGAHYTYAEVPYNKWTQQLLGFRFNDIVGWERNNFDRVIHFLYGFLIAYPIREIFLRIANVRGFWGYFLPLDLTMSTSMLFELIEWIAAGAVGGDLGMAYLGTQGDIWDAHKDMALASCGAVIAMTITALINRQFQRDFAHEWVESLQVKNTKPLGEDKLKELINATKNKNER